MPIMAVFLIPTLFNPINGPSLFNPVLNDFFLMRRMQHHLNLPMNGSLQTNLPLAIFVASNNNVFDPSCFLWVLSRLQRERRQMNPHQNPTTILKTIRYRIRHQIHHMIQMTTHKTNNE
jgi:hypothetical protein